MTQAERKNALIQEMEYRENLFRLMKKRPELPVVPMVNGDIVDDDCCYWLGSWGDCKIGKIWHGKERFFEYDDKDEEMPLIEAYGYEWYENATDEECDEAYKALSWVDCIIVYIELPIW